MPNWINRPPPPAEFAGIRLVRVGTGREFQAYVTSEHLIGANTHFWRKRTVPCTAPDCPACSDAVPARWHGYISVWSTQSRTQYVLELTALAAVAVADYEDRHGTLRGAGLTAHRLGNKPNSPVHVDLVPQDLDLRTLPRQVNMQHFLETIWNVKPNREDGQHEPPLGQNIRNNLPSNSPTSSAQPLQFRPHELSIEAHKHDGNGQV